MLNKKDLTDKNQEKVVDLQTVVFLSFLFRKRNNNKNNIKRSSWSSCPWTERKQAMKERERERERETGSWFI